MRFSLFMGAATRQPCTPSTSAPAMTGTSVVRSNIQACYPSQSIEVQPHSAPLSSSRGHFRNAARAGSLASSAHGVKQGYPFMKSAVPARGAVRCAAGASLTPQPQPGSSISKANDTRGSGVFLLLLINVVVFLADHLLLFRPLKMLYLNHAHPQLHQFVTHMFCHADASHLMNNLFMLLVFGKMVEETEGDVGVWLVYFITGLGAAIASILLMPSTYAGSAVVSVGASGAIFGLFTVSVLTRLLTKRSLRSLLEAVILGQFVVRQVIEEGQKQFFGGLAVGVGKMKVSHVAHLSGALAGVLLVLLLHRLPSGNNQGSGAADKNA